MEIIFFVVVIVGVGVVMATVEISQKDERKKAIQAIQAALEKIEDFTSSQSFVGEDGESGIAIDESRAAVCLLSRKSEGVSTRVIEYKDVLSCELYEDGQTVTKTSRSSQIGGALVGGIALGAAGAVIGGLSGKTVSEKGKVKRIDLRLIVNDTQSPCQDVNFLNLECKTDEFLYKTAIEQARHWHGLIAVIIKKADQKDEGPATATRKGESNTDSIADEISKLAQLKSEGILTDDEFQYQKMKLLSSRK